MKKKLYFIIVPIVLSLFLTNLSFGTASTKEVSTTETESQDDLDYYVSRYLVVLEVDGLNLHATINITYNVKEGIKTEGFKRFLTPSDGTIDRDTIEVCDDENLELEWDYKVVEGKKGKKFKEISFEHPGFTGTKTITMKFLMKKWIVEYFSYSQIELRNIGTFKIDVKKAIYRIIFPRDYKLEDIDNSESGKEKIDEHHDRFIYTFKQKDSISSDIIIRCKPNLTDTDPTGSLNMLIPLCIILSIIFIPITAYGIWWSRLSIEEKIAIREKRASRRRSSGGCGGGCGGCGG